MKISHISNLVKLLNNVENNNYIDTLIEAYQKNPIYLNDFCIQIGYKESQLLELLDSNKNIIIIDYINKKWLVTNKQLNTLKSMVIEFIKSYFDKNSYAININKELISSQINIKVDFIDYLLYDLEEEKKITKKNDGWIISDYKVDLKDEEIKIKDMILKILGTEKFNTSSIDELLIKCNIKDSKLIIRLIKLCESEKLIIRINQGMFITNKNISFLKTELRNFFKINNSLKVSDLKDLIGVSRKYAIPILEYLDKIQFTYREGNERKLIN